jgi:predicted HTH domain antitoxin
MKIEIDNDILKRNNLSESELRLELALFLFQKNIFTLESASKFAEMDSYEFQKELGKHKIPVHYSVKDGLL